MTLDSSGNPTTTAYGGSASHDAYTLRQTGWKWVTLSTGATANAGDFAAVHIYPGAQAPTDGN